MAAVYAAAMSGGPRRIHQAQAAADHHPWCELKASSQRSWKRKSSKTRRSVMNSAASAPLSPLAPLTPGVPGPLQPGPHLHRVRMKRRVNRPNRSMRSSMSCSAGSANSTSFDPSLQPHSTGVCLSDGKVSMVLGQCQVRDMCKPHEAHHRAFARLRTARVWCASRVARKHPLRCKAA